jgi:prolyl oligopeptidase
MLALSRGGADAVEMREFDTVRKVFVEDGFRLEEAKGGVSWKDASTLNVSSEFGEDTMTDSGYPRIAKA